MEPMASCRAALPVAIFVWAHRRHFVLPADAFTMGCFLVSLLLTGALQFLLSYTLALMAFWLIEVSTLIFIVFAFEYIAGGHLFPLDILPPTAAAFLQLTPFSFQLFFPIGIYLGRVQGTELWQGLLLQALWVALFYVVARLVWKRGIRKYTDFHP